MSSSWKHSAPAVPRGPSGSSPVISSRRRRLDGVERHARHCDPHRHHRPRQNRHDRDRGRHPNSSPAPAVGWVAERKLAFRNTPAKWSRSSQRGELDPDSPRVPRDAVVSVRWFHFDLSGRLIFAASHAAFRPVPVRGFPAAGPGAFFLPECPSPARARAPRRALLDGESASVVTDARSGW